MYRIHYTISPCKSQNILASTMLPKQDAIQQQKSHCKSYFFQEPTVALVLFVTAQPLTELLLLTCVLLLNSGITSPFQGAVVPQLNSMSLSAFCEKRLPDSKHAKFHSWWCNVLHACLLYLQDIRYFIQKNASLIFLLL